MVTRRGDELRNWFSEEVAWNLSDVWRRVYLGDYSTLEEQNFILFELLQYHSVVERKLKANRVDTWVERLQGCSWNTNRIKVQLPFGEVKRMSEGFRGLLLQFALELFSFTTDVLFLYVLAVSNEDLFVASLVVLIVAMLARLGSALLLFPRISIRLWWVYVIGTAVCLFETNSGLAIIKLSLKRAESEKRVYSFVEFSSEVQRNEVSVAARNEEKAGWGEGRNIFVVTVLEDLPQLGIQLAYLSRQGSELERLFYFSFVSTIMHILFQWTEALITLSFLRKQIFGISVCCKLQLHDLDMSRDVSFDRKDNSCELHSGYLSCTQNAKVYSVTDVTSRFGQHLRSVSFINCKGMQDTLGNLSSLVTKINLEGSDVNDEGLKLLSRQCTLLTHVYLFRCYEVTENGVMALVKRCRFIVHLNLGNLRISDECVRFIAHRCMMLSGIDLTGSDITNEALEDLSQNCKMLTHVVLNKCDRVSNQGVLDLVESGRHLVEVKFNGLPMTNPKT